MLVYIPTFESKENEREVIQIHEWDTWSLDHTLAKIIYPALCNFHADSRSYPTGLDREDVAEIHREQSDEVIWGLIVNEMITAFYLRLQDDFYDFDTSNEKYNKMQNGLRLFGKYYTHLWR